MVKVYCTLEECTHNVGGECTCEVIDLIRPLFTNALKCEEYEEKDET